MYSTWGNDNIINIIKLKIRNNSNYLIKLKNSTYDVGSEYFNETTLTIFVDGEKVFSKGICEVGGASQEQEFKDFRKEQYRVKEALEEHFENDKLEIDVRLNVEIQQVYTECY